MQVHVINSMTGDIRVHKAGCRDIGRELRRANSDWKQMVPDDTIAEAVAAEMSDGFGWSPDDDAPAPWRAEHIVVLPCCKR